MTHGSSDVMGVDGYGCRPEREKESRLSKRGEQEVALIIGGGDDLGESLAVALAERGMDVAVLFFGQHVQRAQAIKARIVQLGRRCLVLYAENYDGDTPVLSARRAIDCIVRELGRLDVFISLGAPPEAAEAERQNGHREQALQAHFIPNAAVIRAAMRQIVSKDR